MGNCLAPRFASQLRQIDTIMRRAHSHAIGLADAQLRNEMWRFCRRLKSTTTLEFSSGMGTYSFIIKRAGKKHLWLTSEDMYYSAEGSATFWDQPGDTALRRFIYPLFETLMFLDDVRSETDGRYPGSVIMRGARAVATAPV